MLPVGLGVGGRGPVLAGGHGAAAPRVGVDDLCAHLYYARWGWAMGNCSKTVVLGFPGGLMESITEGWLCYSNAVMSRQEVEGGKEVRRPLYFSSGARFGYCLNAVSCISYSH